MDGYIPFPYPVLGNDSEIAGEFLPSLRYTLDPDFITLKMDFELTNEYIQGLIDAHLAEIIIDVLCGKTYYRKVYQTQQTTNFVIKEKASKLREKVEIKFYICTCEALEDYCPVGEDTFFVEKGDIIAVGGATSFIASKEFDPVKAPIKSIVKIIKSARLKDNMEVLYNNDSYVTIELPEETYDYYKNISSGSAEMLHACIVLPALADAIYEAYNGNFSDSAWSSKVKEICINRNIDNPAEEPLKAAQSILNDPIRRALKERYNELMKEEDYGQDESF